MSDPAPAIYVTDGSRQREQLTRCPRLRYLQYHYNGVGYRLKAKSVPLVTGIRAHRAIQRIFEQQLEASDRDGLRKVIREQVDTYHQAAKDGLQELANPRNQATPELSQAAVAQLGGFPVQEGAEGLSQQSAQDYQDQQKRLRERAVAEQACLLEGMLWGFVRVVLPFLQRHYQPLLVEDDRTLMLSCTCGLGDLTIGALDHRRRGCRGVGLMVRPDLVLQHRETGAAMITDWKTSGDVDERRFREQHEDSLQLAVGAFTAERVLGVPVDYGFVIGLNKGWSKGTIKDPVTGRYSGPREQDSIFTYGFYKQGNPPLVEAEYHPRYDYVDHEGKNRKAVESKGFFRTPVWLVNFGQAQGQSGVEKLVMDLLPEELVRAEYAMVGPVQVPKDKLLSYFRQRTALEVRWAQGLHRVEAARPQGLAAVVAVEEEEFPQSWDCWRYNKPCQMLGVCKFGAQLPTIPGEGDKYTFRWPHHKDERQQVQDHAPGFYQLMKEAAGEEEDD